MAEYIGVETTVLIRVDGDLCRLSVGEGYVVRYWIDDDGFRETGRFVEVEDECVLIQDEDGVIHHIEIDDIYDIQNTRSW